MPMTVFREALTLRPREMSLPEAAYSCSEVRDPGGDADVLQAEVTDLFEIGRQPEHVEPPDGINDEARDKMPHVCRRARREGSEGAANSVIAGWPSRMYSRSRGERRGCCESDRLPATRQAR
jgi:hypothetical protein